MAEPGTYDIVVHDRTTLNLIFSLKDAAGNAVNLTGYSVAARATGSTSWLPDGPFDFVPTITNAVAGEITIKKTDVEIGTLEQGTKTKPVWDMIITDVAGDRTKILQGTFEIVSSQTV